MLHPVFLYFHSAFHTCHQLASHQLEKAGVRLYNSLTCSIQKGMLGGKIKIPSEIYLPSRETLFQSLISQKYQRIFNSSPKTKIDPKTRNPRISTMIFKIYSQMKEAIKNNEQGLSTIVLIGQKKLKSRIRRFGNKLLFNLLSILHLNVYE